MSYEILYDRRYVKFPADGEKQKETLYMPILQTGSNNTYEVTYSGREIPEKNWMNIDSYIDVDTGEKVQKLLFNEEEIKAMAKCWAKDTDYLFKNRNTQWKPEELEAWIISGMKTAMTVEEYKKRGVDLRADLDVWDEKYEHRRRSVNLDNTESALSAHVTLRTIQENDNLPQGGHINVGFVGRDCMKALATYRRKETARKFMRSDKFYVLVHKNNRMPTYLMGLPTRLCGNVLSAKKIENEEKAQKFLANVKDLWLRKNFVVKEIRPKELDKER